jgi:DNA-binding NarL/FixJ family response regulator
MRKVLLVEPHGQTKLREQLEALGYEVITRATRDVDLAVVPVDAIVALPDVPAVAVGTYDELARVQGREDFAYLVEVPASTEGLGRALHEAMQPRPAAMNGDTVVADDIATKRLTDAELTPREVEVALLRMQGFRIREVADKLHLTPKTVKVHTTNACAKVGVQGVGELRQKIFPL